jgi:hypothetical protein
LIPFHRVLLFPFASDCIYSSLKRGKTEVFKRIMKQKEKGALFVAVGDGDEEAAAAARLG